MVTEGEIQDPLADGWWLNSRMDPMGSQKLSRGAPTRCCLLHPNSTALKNPRHFLTQLMQTFNCSCVDRPMQANLIWLSGDSLEDTCEKGYSSSGYCEKHKFQIKFDGQSCWLSVWGWWQIWYAQFIISYFLQRHRSEANLPSLELQHEL